MKKECSIAKYMLDSFLSQNATRLKIIKPATEGTKPNQQSLISTIEHKSSKKKYLSFFFFSSF
jgi:hypothetical protein